MRKNATFFSVLLVISFCVFGVVRGYGQADSIKWVLTSNTVPTKFGAAIANITATNMHFGTGLNTTSHNGSGANAKGYDSGSCFAWNNDDTLGFSFSPNCGTYTISKVSFSHQTDDAAGACLELRYSINGAASINAGTTSGVSLTTDTFIVTLPLVITPGQKISFFLFGLTATNASKFISIKNFVVTGTISGNTLPTPGITNNTGSTEINCTFPSISLTATGGGTYSWSDGTTNAIHAGITAAGTFSVTVTGANGCVAASVPSVTLTKNVTLPTPGITNNTGSTEINCTFPSISLTATGGGTYSWSDGTTNAIHAGIAAAGTFSVTVTGANGCVAGSVPSVTLTKNITPPTAGITNNTGTTIITCSVPSISLTATGGVTFIWDDGSTSATHAPISAAGTYTVTVTAANGCTASSNISLTKNGTLPTAVITNNPNVNEINCTNPNITLTASGGISFLWNDGTTSAAHTAFSSAGTFTVTVTAANGCTSSAIEILTKNVTPPIAVITNNPNVNEINCTNPNITLTASGGTSFLWNDATTSAAHTAFSSAGTFTVTVTAANGCTASTSEILTKNITPPTSGITNNTGVTVITCTTPSISLTATGAGTYIWDDGSTSATHSPISSAGTFTVTVTAANGCTATATISLTKNVTSPTIVINETDNSGNSDDSTICKGNSAFLTATGGGSYLWSFGNTTAGPHTLSPNASTSFTVTVTNANGCSATRAKFITVSNITSSVNSTVDFCPGVPATISVTLINGGIPNYSIQWTDPNGNVGTACTSIGNNGSCTKTVSPLLTTIYTATITDFAGCTLTKAQQVTFNAPPDLTDFSVTAKSVCLNNPTFVRIQSTSLANGTYTVKFQLLGDNAKFGSATMNFSGFDNFGFFSTGNLSVVSGSGNTIVIDSISPNTGVGCISVPPVLNNTSNTFFVRAQPVSGTVTVQNAPDFPNICEGDFAQANISPGSGGVGCSDLNQFSIDGGTTFSPYTSGNQIPTTGVASVIIKTLRQGCADSSGCISGNSVTKTWNVRINSTNPTQLHAGRDTICQGDTTKLTQTGGLLGTGGIGSGGPVWRWYRDAAFSGSAFEQNSSFADARITVQPAQTTTYWLRSETNDPPCVDPTGSIIDSITVVVIDSSIAGTGISGNSLICSGDSTTLSVIGGTLGTGAQWQWYSGSCGGVPEGTGASITVFPTDTTTYFVQAVNPFLVCSPNTPCVSVKVSVNQPSQPPVRIDGDSSLCSGEPTTLTIIGGSLGDGGAQWHWYRDACGGSSLGTGPTFIVFSDTATVTPQTYNIFVRAEGVLPCPTQVPVNCIQKVITVNPIPQMTSPTAATVCSDDNLNYTIQGNFSQGVLYGWTSVLSGCDSSGSLPLSGNGSQTPGTNNIIGDIITSPNHHTRCYVTYTITLYFVNNNDTCASAPYQLIVTVNPAPTAPNISHLQTVYPPYADKDTLCGGSTNVGFNITNYESGTYYNWSVSDTNLVKIKNSTDSITGNALITFNSDPGGYTANISCIATNDASLGGCPGKTSIPLNVVVLPGDGIDEKKIVKRDGKPDLLIYADNTVDGYKWGVDSFYKQGNDTLIRSQTFLKNKYFQVLVPDSTELPLLNPNIKNRLNTGLYLFWVMVYKINGKDTCYSRVYYNGPYSKKAVFDPPVVPDEISLSAFPNPNNGQFDVLVSGNIYGNITLKMVDLLGQNIMENTIVKTEASQQFHVDVKRIPFGLYFIRIEGSNQGFCVTKVLIK